MLKQAKWLSFITLFILFISFLTISLSREVKDHEQAGFDAFTKAHQSSTEKQNRQRITKDFWIAEDSQRLHHHISCPRSTLFFSVQNKKVKMIEHMFDMKCYMQEKIFKEEEDLKQKLRYIESDEGFYHYDTIHFNAKHVFIAFFEMLGTHLQKDLDVQAAQMTGDASQVQFSFSNNRPTFYAEKFKAHVNPQAITP